MFRGTLPLEGFPHVNDGPVSRGLGLLANVQGGHPCSLAGES